MAAPRRNSPQVEIHTDAWAKLTVCDDGSAMRSGMWENIADRQASGSRHLWSRDRAAGPPGKRHTNRLVGTYETPLDVVDRAADNTLLDVLVRDESRDVLTSCCRW